MSPTARTLEHLRRQGYLPWVVERWLPTVNKRRDFLGCIDILALKPGEPVLAIQATSAANVSSRLNKARALGALKTWLAVGGLFEVWGWGLSDKDGRWHVRQVSVRTEDMAVDVLQTIPRRRRLKRGERQRELFA